MRTTSDELRIADDFFFQAISRTMQPIRCDATTNPLGDSCHSPYSALTVWVWAHQLKSNWCFNVLMHGIVRSHNLTRCECNTQWLHNWHAYAQGPQTRGQRAWASNVLTQRINAWAATSSHPFSVSFLPVSLPIARWCECDDKFSYNLHRTMRASTIHRICVEWLTTNLHKHIQQFNFIIGFCLTSSRQWFSHFIADRMLCQMCRNWFPVSGITTHPKCQQANWYQKWLFYVFFLLSPETADRRTSRWQRVDKMIESFPVSIKTQENFMTGHCLYAKDKWNYVQHRRRRLVGH